MISSAALGIDVEAVDIGGKVYIIHPPTIKRLLGASRYLGKVSELDSPDKVVEALSSDSLARALSWLVIGSEELAETFTEVSVNDLADGLITALGMISPESFTVLSALARNVRSLIARPRS